MITIYAPKSGPTELQKDFYKRIETNLRILEDRAKEFLLNHNVRGGDVSAFKIYSIEIGDEEEIRKNMYVIEFSDEDANEIYRIQFKKDLPASLAVDD